MTEIIPAIIPESFYDLEDQMALVDGLTNSIQIDVCDGIFVPSKSWPYTTDKENNFEKIINEELDFPFWKTLDFEVDLMVSNPENIVEDWIRIGANRVVLHLESTPNMKDLITDLRNKYGWFGESTLAVEIGIAINVNTPIEKIFEYLDTHSSNGRSLVDFVQFMGIREIGYQGQFFDERVIGRIRDLRQAYPEVIISVDGGVKLENAHEIVEAGVNRLVSGSAIFESENIKDTIDQLKSF